MIPGSSSVLVVSDSHGNAAALTEVLTWAKAYSGGGEPGKMPGKMPGKIPGVSPGKMLGKTPGEIPAIGAAVFLGDGADDLAPASARAGFPFSWNTVRGNVDTNFSLPGAMLLEISGDSRAVRKLFLSHGNAYNVGESHKTIAAAARTNGAEAALFGHTHVPHYAMQDGILLLNPGSIGRPRSNTGPTFAILECPPTGPLGVRFFGLTSRGRKTAIQELEL